MEKLRNEKEEKGKEKGEKGKEEKDEKKKPGFVAKAVLAAGLMIAAAAGCEERTINNYNCPDSGTEDVAAEVEEDAGHDVAEELPDVVEEPDAVEDVMEEEVECVADLTPTTCDSSEPVAEGVMSRDEPLEAGNITFELRDTEEHGGIVSAIIAVVDECGEVLKLDKVAEGTTKEFTIKGAKYYVTVDTVHLSEENPWADASVSISCDTNYCSLVMGDLNQGEMIPFDGFKMSLDDFDRSNPEEPAILVSILDSADHILSHLRIPKDEYGIFFGSGEVYRINVLEVGMGDTFTARWARVDITKTCPE